MLRFNPTWHYVIATYQRLVQAKPTLEGAGVRLVCGSFWGKRGPVEGIAADPIYVDVSVPPGKRKTLPVETTRHAFAYVFAGSGKFCNASGPLAVPTEGVKWLETVPPTEAGNRSLVLFDSGENVVVQAGDEGIRFLLVSGKLPELAVTENRKKLHNWLDNLTPLLGCRSRAAQQYFAYGAH